MAFEEIEAIKPAGVAAIKVPDGGILVRPRVLTLKNKSSVRYIYVKIGKALAKNLSMTDENEKLRVAFGTGSDAGKIMITVDAEKGRFNARRDTRGCYSLTLNEATAGGLFALDFPQFAIEKISFVPGAGTPNSLPRFIFPASAEMLAVADD